MKNPEPLLEITATDPRQIAEQQEVLDAFNAWDKAASAIDEGCEYLERVLDELGAPRYTHQQLREMYALPPKKKRKE